ncbi:MAG: Gfo/Idh/MocA family protein [Promethearchaeota archaeon]
MRTNRKMNVALIGCGYWGANIARVLHELKEERKPIGEVTLFDIDKSKMENIAKKYAFNIADSLEDILNDRSISAILVVTPSSTHFTIAKKALTAKKDVYVEKPFTLNSEEATELYNIAVENNLILMVGLLFRYHESILELKRRINLGEFGKILYLYGYKYGYAVPNEDSGVVFALAVNDLDISCFLLDQEFPLSINAELGNYLTQNFEELSNITLTFQNNIKAIFIDTWLMPSFERVRELILVGSDKSAKLNYLKPNELLIYDMKIEKEEIDKNIRFMMKKGETQKVVFDFVEPLKVEVNHFIECIHERKRPKTDGKIAINSIKMCELVLKSAGEGKKIFLKDK